MLFSWIAELIPWIWYEAWCSLLNLAKLKLALNKGSSWKIEFTSMFLILAIPLVVLLLLSACIFLCKGLRCINTSINVYKESSDLICVAEKHISCSCPSKLQALLNYSWITFSYVLPDPQVIPTKMWTAHSYPHISQFGSGESKSSRDKILKIHGVMKLN